MTDHSVASPPDSALDAEALDWFTRYSDAPEAAYADTAFRQWLAGHPGREAAFTRWQADWQRLDALPSAGIEQLRRQLQAGQAAAERAQAQVRAPRRLAWPGKAVLASQARLALAVLPVLVTTSGYVLWNHWQRQPVFAQNYQTERGQQQSVQLPDGSRLRLDTATRVEVSLYRHRREVRLPEGQAVFEVQGDNARPFDVLAGNTRITVVGTRFSVRHTAGSPVRVAVEEGQVRVARARAAADTSSASASGPDAKGVLLAPGQQVTATEQGQIGAIAAVASSGIAPWRDGRITLDNVPLSEALAEFERYGPTHMVVHAPAVAALRLSGTFDPRHLANFRQALPKVLPVRLQERGAETEIVAHP